MRASVLLLLAAALLVSAVAAGGARNWNTAPHLSQESDHEDIHHILSAFDADVDETLSNGATSDAQEGPDQDVQDAVPAAVLNVPGSRCPTSGAGFMCVSQCSGTRRLSVGEGGNLGCGAGNVCCKPFAVGEVCQKWSGSCVSSCDPANTMTAVDGSAVCGLGQVCCQSGPAGAAPAVAAPVPSYAAPAPAAPIDGGSATGEGPSASALLPGINVYDSSSYSIGTYGDLLQKNKAALQAALTFNAVTPAQRVLFTAMAMLETNDMDLSERDASKDTRTDGSANVSIFNLSVDMVTRLGYANAKNLNKPGYLNDAVKVLKKGVATWGARSLCAYVRGGYTGWKDGVSYGVPDYLRTIATSMTVIDSDPTLLTDNRRVDISLNHV